MKKWWFSIVCWVIALAFPIYTIIAIGLFDEETLFYTSILMNCITSSSIFLVIGVANQPRKENKDE